MAVRYCPFCGKPVPLEARDCRACGAALRAYVPDRPASGVTPAAALMRRGALWMVLAAVLYYFASGRSPWTFPIPFAPMLVDWVLPLLFLSGFALVGFGLFRHFTQ